MPVGSRLPSSTVFFFRGAYLLFRLFFSAYHRFSPQWILVFPHYVHWAFFHAHPMNRKANRALPAQVRLQRWMERTSPPTFSHLHFPQVSPFIASPYRRFIIPVFSRDLFLSPFRFPVFSTSTFPPFGMRKRASILTSCLDSVVLLFFSAFVPRLPRVLTVL